MKISRFSRLVAGFSFLVTLAVELVPLAGFSQIQDPFLPPPGPPVRIVSPADHAVFYAPVDIPIFAFTHAISMSLSQYAETDFTNVEVYATNGNVRYDLGPATRLDATTNRPVPYFNYTVDHLQLAQFSSRFHSVWCLVWSNVPQGSYALTAVANGRYLLDNISRTSAPVNVTILSSTNGTNPTDIVSILANDPVAIAGTNISWVWPGLTNTVPSWSNWPTPRWGYFTNWGPKPALFTVRRFGDASSNLTVNYKIGGTASNGVDYIALPGFVNIAAGAGYGLIPIVPVDNGSNNFVKTITLTLTPATNTPSYVIGFPQCAEGVIYYHWPRPVALPFTSIPPAGSFLNDGSFHFNAAGPDGAWFAVQSSPDLVNWTTICTNQVVQGSVDFIDPNPAGNSSGFYQIVLLNNSPQ